MRIWIEGVGVVELKIDIDGTTTAEGRAFVAGLLETFARYLRDVEPAPKSLTPREV